MTSLDWNAFRQEMPITKRWAYFDHAAVAPITLRAKQGIEAWAEEAVTDGTLMWPTWAKRVEATRKNAAGMLNASAEEIALTWSTTAGVNFVAEGFPWQEGDNVVTLEDEYPANQYPWLHLEDRGVETRRVPVVDRRPDFDQIANAIDSKTRILTISWVGFSNGYRHDLDRLAELAHSRGALLFVDGIQATGVFPLDVQKTPIDFLAADGHKWMLGPEGAGIFYMRSEHLDLLRPVGVGWNSVQAPMEFSKIDLTIRRAASRYEGGSANMAGFIGLGASLGLLNEYGQEAMAARIIEITGYACERLASIGAEITSPRIPGHESGIVLFTFPGKDLLALRKQCIERDVVVSFRSGNLRISAHAYNTHEDVDRLIEALS
jgi:cysteine desulfurase / selenocysteine lyase